MRFLYSFISFGTNILTSHSILKSHMIPKRGSFVSTAGVCQTRRWRTDLPHGKFQCRAAKKTKETKITHWRQSGASRSRRKNCPLSLLHASKSVSVQKLHRAGSQAAAAAAAMTVRSLAACLLCICRCLDPCRGREVREAGERAFGPVRCKLLEEGK